MFQSAAQATVFTYNYSGPAGGYLQDSFESLSTSYDTDQEFLTWESSFNSDGFHDIDGAWLVLSDGPNAKGAGDLGNQRELAIFYMDGVQEKLTAFRYNGENNASSYQQEDFLGAWDLDVTTGGGITTFGFDIDVSALNADDDGGFLTNWQGVQFGEKIGLWFHGAGKDFNSAYDNEWKLTEFTFNKDFYIDQEDEMTNVPEPGLLGLAFLAGLGLIGRKLQGQRA
jgi:hypothetical protein